MEENKEELRKKSSKSITSFVCGIIAVLTPLFYYLCLPTGVIAIVFGTKEIKRTGSKLAKAGLIMGIVGLSLFIFIYMMFIGLIIRAY